MSQPFVLHTTRFGWHIRRRPREIHDEGVQLLVGLLAAILRGITWVASLNL